MKIMIYGAYGFTAKLIIEKMVAEGMNPVLAGRKVRPLEEVANEFGLTATVFDLNSPKVIRRELERVDLVLHCAGPFKVTGKPMIDACIDTSTHYLDITGELEIFEYCQEVSNNAKANNVLLLPGCGFDIIPTENLGVLLHSKLPDANSLEIAIYGLGKPSKGTTRSVIGVMASGSRIRQNGDLVEIPYGSQPKEFTFANGKTRTCIPVPLPDLIATFQSTGIANIKMYFTMKPMQIRMTGFFQPLMRVLRFNPLASIVEWIVGKLASNPDEEFRADSPSYIIGIVHNGEKSIQADLVTPNAYDLTATATVQAVKHIEGLNSIPTGYVAPSEVLGSDFITTLGGVDINYHQKY